MPTVKVCYWNVQNYGAGVVVDKWGADSNLRNTFITMFVLQQQIDVLLIMEASVNCAGALEDLVNTLNADPLERDDPPTWAGSFCGSALTSQAADPPTDESELRFKTDARVEGYAVCWRTDQTPRFRMLDGLHDIAAGIYWDDDNPDQATPTPLNMSTRGRPADWIGETTNWQVKGGYTQPNQFPYDENGLMHHWPPLQMPTTSSRNPTPLRHAKARRPVYVVLQLATAGGDRDRLCPVAVYHAPSNQTRAELGVLQSALCRELYVTNALDGNGDPDPLALVSTDRNVFGGDFNFSVSQANWNRSEYRYFTDPLNRSGDGGAGCRGAPASILPDTDRRTAVALMQSDHITPIRSISMDAYYHGKIDLAFFPRASTGARIDVPQLLLNDAVGWYAETLQMLHLHLLQLVAGLGPNQQVDALLGPQTNMGTVAVPDWVPVLSAAWGSTFVAWQAFMTQLSNGRMTGARQAAELYVIFVSDHLPLVVDVTF